MNLGPSSCSCFWVYVARYYSNSGQKLFPEVKFRKLLRNEIVILVL